MSLFATLGQTANALRVSQIGLQVVGNNIANANTPGYIRQELLQAPSDPTRVGGLLLGSGVEAVGVVQKVDYALAGRLREAASQLAGSERVEQANRDLEQILGELGEGDFSSNLSNFNNTLHDLFNRPQDPSLRELVTLRGDQLAKQLREIHGRASDSLSQANGEVSSAAVDINRLTSRIAALNRRIIEIEGGRTLGSDATGLRDDRLQALTELGSLVEITVQEQTTGGVNVFVGGDYIVADAYFREVEAVPVNGNAREGVQLRIKGSGAVLDFSEGRIGGAVVARDQVYGRFLKRLDELAQGLARTFNQIHVQGQGRTGFTDLTGTVKLVDPAASLDDAGLDFAPENGTFEIQLYDQDGELLKKQRITVTVSGTSGGMGIDDIADQISAIDGLEGIVTDAGELRIRTSSPYTQFAFGEDTSGFLAAAGLNTFFVGDSALTLGVNPLLLDDPQLLAVSQGGIGEDSENLALLVDAIERAEPAIGGISVRDFYDQLVTDLAQEVSVQKSVTDGLRTYHSTLESDHLAATGVNLDEEAIKMIAYQRAFQASARVVATVSELLDTLVNL
jgi:flagellar hook-associated protein 1 FlgK